MVALFQDRFLRAILPYTCFLKIFGICICPSTTKRKLINGVQLLHFWKFAWFILNFINQIFSFMRRTFYLKFVPGFLFPFREFLICIINYSTSCILDSLVHAMLLSTIGRTVDYLLLLIENIDSKLQNPKLFRIRNISTVFICWCCLMVCTKYYRPTAYAFL